jgi:hypothetical protein
MLISLRISPTLELLLAIKEEDPGKEKRASGRRLAFASFDGEAPKEEGR